MATINKMLNTHVKEQLVSNGRMKKNKPEVASSVVSNLPAPGKSLTHEKAVERVFKKNSELFQRLAK